MTKNKIISQVRIFLQDSDVRRMEIKLKNSRAHHTRRKYADLDLIVLPKPKHEKFIALNSSFKREVLSTGTII